MSMRLEKSWGVWTLDFRPDFDALQSGMEAFINWNKDFIGKDATQDVETVGPDRKLITMVVDAEGIDVTGDEAIVCDGKTIGYVSSGGFAHHVRKSMAMGYVSADMASPEQVVQVEIMGVMYDAKVLGEPIYDASGENMRA